MKQLFLASSADKVMKDIVTKLDKNASEYNVAFINTAAEIEKGERLWVSAEKDALLEVGFKIEEFSITNMTKVEIENKLNGKQIIYFCGGNPFYLLDQVIKTHCDEIIKNKIENGIIYMGSSAGAMIAGIRIDLVATTEDKLKTPNLKSNGLNIIDITILPHWGSEDMHSEYKLFFDALYVENVKILPISDNQYIWVNEETITVVQI